MKEKLVKALNSVSNLEGIRITDGEICVEAKANNKYMLMMVLAKMIECGDIEVILKGNESGKQDYLNKLLADKNFN